MNIDDMYDEIYEKDKLLDHVRKELLFLVWGEIISLNRASEIMNEDINDFRNHPIFLNYDFNKCKQEKIDEALKKYKKIEGEKK